MRKIILALLITIISFSYLITDASAKRFGGGKSVGMSRQASSFSKPTSTGFNTGAAAAQAAKPASGLSRWLGPLAGLAAGGLLASLFMGHGLGTGIMSWLLIGGLAFLVIGFLRSRFQQPSPQTAQPFQNQAANQPFSNNAFNPVAANTQPRAEVTGVDEAGFLRQAKSMFIRLQAAYDSKNLADIREFTSPEISAEVQLQFQERGDEPNVTEVVNIDAELLDMSVQGQNVLATVRFTGLVREEVGAAPVAINEMWHFQKNDFRPSWMVVGIQQEQ